MYIVYPGAGAYAMHSVNKEMRGRYIHLFLIVTGNGGGAGDRGQEYV
jgi:hypothetical protein